MSTPSKEPVQKGLTREQIARRAAQELRDGFYVNLGIGMPTLVANYVPDGIEVILQSENGMLGIGPYPYPGEEDPDLINAGKETITEIAGTAYFDSAESFAMIRGGHIDLAILGAMDLVSGAKRVIVTMEHVSRDGKPKLLKECALPLTGKRCVHTIVTDHALFDVVEGGLLLKELAPGVTVDDIKKITEANVLVASEIKPMLL
jgi:3-oxoacid CoA-transferase subunit B